MGGNNSKAADPDAGNRYSTPVPVKDEDYSKPLPREKLPQELQKIVDNEESLWDKVYEGQYVTSLSTGPCSSLRSLVLLCD